MVDTNRDGCYCSDADYAHLEFPHTSLPLRASRVAHALVEEGPIFAFRNLQLGVANIVSDPIPENFDLTRA